MRVRTSLSALMLLPALALCQDFLQDYETIVVKRLAHFGPTDVYDFYIPGGQCTGRIDRRTLPCSGPLSGLGVTVRDTSYAAADVVVNDDVVNIYRAKVDGYKNVCSSLQAKVHVEVYCGLKEEHHQVKREVQAARALPPIGVNITE